MSQLHDITSNVYMVERAGTIRIVADDRRRESIVLSFAEAQALVDALVAAVLVDPTPPGDRSDFGGLRV